MENNNESVQMGIAIAAIAVGATIVAACMWKASRILKKDDALWEEMHAEQN